MRTGATRAAQDRDPPITVQQRSEPVEIAFVGYHDWPRRQKACGLRERRVDSRLQCNIPRDHDDRHAAPADCLADRDLQYTWHLVGPSDQFAIVAALAKEILGVGFLEIPGPDLVRRDVRRYGEYRHARAVAVEQAVDQVQIARPAAAGAERKLTSQMRLGT